MGGSRGRDRGRDRNQTMSIKIKRELLVFVFAKPLNSTYFYRLNNEDTSGSTLFIHI